MADDGQDWRLEEVLEHGVAPAARAPARRRRRRCRCGSSSAYCDDNGAFVIDRRPGAVAVTCFGTGPSYSNGRAELTVTPGQDASCEIPVVKIAQNVQFGSIGAQIQPGPMPVRFMTVTPRGTADRAGVRAGDIVSTVDGASVLKLTPMAVQIIVLQRPIGATVHLGLCVATARRTPTSS